jgi:hypothetical protein
MVAALGWLCALAYRSNCLDPGPPIAGPPEGGTPRAGLCDAVPPGWAWTVLVIVPALVVALVAAWRGPGRRSTFALAGLLAVGQVALAIVAGSLDYADTI